jgi:hypothetical protein
MKIKELGAESLHWTENGGVLLIAWASSGDGFCNLPFSAIKGIPQRPETGLRQIPKAKQQFQPTLESIVSQQTYWAPRSRQNSIGVICKSRSIVRRGSNGTKTVGSLVHRGKLADHHEAGFICGATPCFEAFDETPSEKTKQACKFFGANKPKEKIFTLGEWERGDGGYFLVPQKSEK